MSGSEFEREYFEVSSNYASGWLKGRAPVETRRLARYVRGLQRGGRLLDIGSGRCEFAIRTSRQFYTVATDVSAFGVRFGLDQSSGTLRVARAVGASLPFGDETFDVVTAMDVLEHVPDPSGAIAEIARVLKATGLIVMKTPHTGSIGRDWKGSQWHGYRDPTHISVLPPSVWVRHLQSAHFDIIDTFHDGLCDSPYFKRVPPLLQHLAFKVPMILLFGAGLRFPPRLGESIIIAARKRASPADAR
jgi:SAM-dependent methyltransferase